MTHRGLEAKLLIIPCVVLSCLPLVYAKPGASDKGIPVSPRKGIAGERRRRLQEEIQELERRVKLQ
ncbi:MAG: hypothetical protein AB1733_00165 [Thermodesulfobacteriota bacterium]